MFEEPYDCDLVLEDVDDDDDELLEYEPALLDVLRCVVCAEDSLVLGDVVSTDVDDDVVELLLIEPLEYEDVDVDPLPLDGRVYERRYVSDDDDL